MTDLDAGLERVQAAHAAMLDALENYRLLLGDRIQGELASGSPNQKRLAIYRYGSEDLDRAIKLVDVDLAEKVLLIVNTRFSLKQAESSGGMIKLGALTDESTEEIDLLRRQGDQPL